MTEVRLDRLGWARLAVIAAAVVIAGHGLVHLMGVALLWKLGQPGQLRYADAVPAAGSAGAYVVGGLWLVAAVLFVTAAVLLVAGHAGWRMIALAGAVVSASVIGLAPGQAVAGLVVDGLVLVLVAVTIGKKPIKRPVSPGRRPRFQLGALIGSGDRIGAFVLPFVLAGVALNIAFPMAFSLGGPPPWLQVTSAFILTAGVVVWAWSVLLILTKVRAGELVTTGPYFLVKHPLYTSVALLVLPWLGFTLNTWLGALIGVALYVASRLFAPAEEADLADRFGRDWDAYCRRVKVPWL